MCVVYNIVLIQDLNEINSKISDFQDAIVMFLKDTG